MINIIVAVADNGVIGCQNKLIWHISEDLKRFKRLTTGNTVVMGRKTFESIGRPLPNRKNIVITRDASFTPEGVMVVNSIQDALKAGGEIFIIGGGEIYAQTLPLAGRLHLTKVDQSPKGDTYFPAIDPADWTEVACQKCDGYSFIDYERTSAK